MADPATGSLYCTGRDVTAQKRDEDERVRLALRIAEQTAELSRRETQLRQVIAEAHDAFVAIDQNGAIVEWNPTAEAKFGWLRDEAIGRTLRDLIVPARHREAHGRRLAQLLSTGQHPAIGRRVQIELMHRDGHELWVEFTISPVRADQAWRFTVFIRDLTADNAARDQLQASLDEKEVLLKEIHHRVKNNLQVVSSLLNLQAASAQDPQLRESLTESQSRVRAMALLHETLYQSGNLAGVDFAAFANTLWTYLTRTFGKAGAGLRFVPDIDAPPLAIDQAVPCALILTELLSNTLKYACLEENGGAVSVSLGAVAGDATRLRLRVADAGAGFSDDERAAAVARGSIGLKLIDALAHQLGATPAWSGPGTVFTMTFTLNQHNGPERA